MDFWDLSSAVENIITIIRILCCLFFILYFIHLDFFQAKSFVKKISWLINLIKKIFTNRFQATSMTQHRFETPLHTFVYFRLYRLNLSIRYFVSRDLYTNVKNPKTPSNWTDLTELEVLLLFCYVWEVDRVLEMNVLVLKPPL